MAQVVVVSPVKIHKESFERDAVIQIDDPAILDQLIRAGAVRLTRTISDAVPVAVIAASATDPASGEPPTSDAPEAELSFEQWCDTGNDPRGYPPRGFTAKDTAAWRAWNVAMSNPQLSVPKMPTPTRVLSNPAFEPRIREIR